MGIYRAYPHPVVGMKEDELFIFLVRWLQCPVLLAMNMNAITTVMRFFMPHGEVSPEVAKEVGSVRRFEATHTSENPQSSAHWNQPSLSSVSEKEEGVMQQQHLDEGLDKLLR